MNESPEFERYRSAAEAYERAVAAGVDVARAEIQLARAREAYIFAPEREPQDS